MRRRNWINVLTADGGKLLKDAIKNDDLLIESFRIDSVPGTHTVIYDSEVDKIEF